MKILEICTSESLGGLELYFIKCCIELNKRDLSISALVFPSSQIHDRLSELNIDIHLSKGKIHDLLSAIREIKPDILHIHHKKDILSAAICRRLHPTFKYVHTRQMDFPRKKKNPFHWFIYDSMDLIITITERLKSQMIQNLPVNPTKISRLYYGVDIANPKKERCNELSIDHKKFNIGVIARIDDKKQQHVAVEALVKLSNPQASLHLIGGTTNQTYADRLKKYVQVNHLENQIHFHGFVDAPQEIMPCFDVIVLTTAIETFGLVLPEAMRMGVAVIGANGGGVPEIIEDEVTGLLFEPNNSNSLHDCFLKIMDKKKRKTIEINGKEKADNLFEINSHFDQLVIFFNTSING